MAIRGLGIRLNLLSNILAITSRAETVSAFFSAGVKEFLFQVA